MNNVLSPYGTPTSRDWPIIALRGVSLAAIALTIYVRLFLRDAPFDDAEGDFSYAAQLMLQGIPPYELASSMKLPGTSLVYALFMSLFGETRAAIHTGFAVANIATVALLFFLGRRLFGEGAGWVAAASYALLSTGSGVYGMLGMAEHLVVAPALLALLLLLRWRESPNVQALLWSGFLCGAAVLMKQAGAFFALFGVLHVLWVTRRNPRDLLRYTGVFSLAAALPLLATAFWFWLDGVFGKFWFWTVTYAGFYTSYVSPVGGLRILAGEFRRIMAPDDGLWMLGAAGVTFAVMDLRSRDFFSPAASFASGRRAASIWALLFLVFSFLAVCPGFYFRPYYFVLMLPAVALLGGAALERAGDYITRGQCTALFSFVLFLAMIPLFLVVAKRDAIRELFPQNPFLVAGEYIKNHSAKDARLAVLGSDPEVYFYAQRHSASDQVLTYPLGENQPFAAQMQEELINDIERVKPEYIVAVNMYPSWNFLPGFCPIEPQHDPKPCDMFRPNDREDVSNTAWGWDYMAGGWVFRPDFPTRIFDWFAEWGPQNYDAVGVISILSGTETQTVWGRPAEGYVPPAPGLFLRIYKRKT